MKNAAVVVLSSLLAIVACGGEAPIDESSVDADAGFDVIDEDDPPDTAPTAMAVCEVGTVEPCPCPGGKQGWSVCVEASGRHSACGCENPQGPDILVLPPTPVVTTCGNMTCAPYSEEETEVSARPCCTPEGRCGSSSNFIFGAACVERGGDPGQPSAACPDENPNFLDLIGCCRKDGQCGLSIDHVPNWDVGCLERGEMARLLNAGSGARNFLSLIFFLPIRDASFAPMACDAR